MNIKKITAVIAALTVSVTAVSFTAFAAGTTADTDFIPVTITINEECFPDDNFRRYVAENFDTDGNGRLSQKERDAVTEIGVYGREIKSLMGISCFQNLEELDCRKNYLTSIDVSENTKLTGLYCWGNKLTELDISNNTKLKDLRCFKNKIANLDVNRNTELETLICDTNELTSLDVSKNTKLRTLWCSNNKIDSLDVSQNTKLIIIYCENNCLASFDVKECTELVTLVCFGNDIKELDVSRNKKLKLENFDCDKNVKIIK